MKEKPNYLYHGSRYELVGDMLIPKKARDLNDHPDMTLEAVYASDMKEEALAMALLSCNGVRSASCDVKNEKVVTIVYRGWPEDSNFYLYTLSSQTFENRPCDSHQWVSFVPVRPIKIEKLEVKDYIHLLRKATEKEKEEWYKKHASKIKPVSAQCI